MSYVPGPDFPGGAQIISSPSEIAQIYQAGRGSLKVRARWVIEDMARGQWKLVVNEMPPGTSTQKSFKKSKNSPTLRSRLVKKRSPQTKIT